MLYSVRLETKSWAPKLIRKLFIEGAEQNSQAVFSQVAFSTTTGHQQIAICWLLKRVQIKDTYDLVVKAKSIFYTISGFELYSPLAAKSSMIHYSIKLLNPESSIISRNINITVLDGLKHNSSAWIWSFKVQGNVTDIIFPSLSVHCKISKQSIKCISCDPPGSTARAYGKHVHAVNEMRLGVSLGADGLTLCRVTVYCSHTVSSMTGFWGERRKDYHGWVYFTGQINNVFCDVTTKLVH